MEALIDSQIYPLPDPESAARWRRREDELWPAVERMIAELKASGGAATTEFNRLWEMIRMDVRKAIRGNPWRVDDIDAVESNTYMEVLKKREDFDPAKGTFLLWSRGIARMKCKQRTRPGKEMGGDGEMDQRSEPGNQERQLPPSECFQEMLNWLQEGEAHRALVFLLKQYLDWQPLEVANKLSSKTLSAIAAIMLAEIKQRYPELKNVESLFARLLAKCRRQDRRTLADFYEDESPSASVSHWSYSERRGLGDRVIGSAAKLLTGVSSLRAGAHERLTFLWARFLHGTLDELHGRAHQTLLSLLQDFCSGYDGKTDLDLAAITVCTAPLKKDLRPGVTLAQCSRGILAEEFVVWCERVQSMLRGHVKSWNVVAYAYLCGALPGITGPAKKGAA
jgi:DNA-directed RNA polymerase specialized sigma24 family protein